jgi:hypothetical protein
MSLDQAPQNKMMSFPPAKKGWHFASDGLHAAIFIEAETIYEAETLYHKVKKLLRPDLPVSGQSTAVVKEEHEAIN